MADVESALPPLTRDLAITLCNEIRWKREGKWYRFFPGQCWGCEKSSNGVPEKMCMHVENGGYTGCTLVNRRYAEYCRLKVKTEAGRSRVM